MSSPETPGIITALQPAPNRDWSLGLLTLALLLAACGSKNTSPPTPPASASKISHAEHVVPVEFVTPTAIAGAPTAARADGRLMRRAPACSYLSADEVSRILKGSIGKPSEKEFATASACSYPPLDMTSFQQAQIDIEWQAAGSATLEDQIAQTFGSNAVGSRVAHHVQLGDSASYSGEGILRIHAGGALISITVINAAGLRTEGACTWSAAARAHGIRPSRPWRGGATR